MLITEILKYAQGDVLRSSALSPLLRISVSILSLTIIACHWTENIVCYGFGVMGLIAVVIFLISYLYLMVKNPDALRSESYSIQKLAMEKGYYGDDTLGMLKETEIPQIGGTGEKRE